MKKFSVIFALLFSVVLIFSSCSKDEPTIDGQQNISNGDASNLSAEGGDEWWQQYTTQPGAAVNTDNSTTKKNVTNSNKPSNNSQTKPNSTSNNSTTKTQTAPAEKYTKVDSNTMKFNVKSDSENGVVTLTKSASNKFIKTALDSVNSTFSTNFTANNTMCYSSTLKNMQNITLVYIFSGSQKNTSTLNFVVQFKGDSIQSFGKITIDGVDVPLEYWPCASSGDSVYTEYLNSFKQVSGEYYSAGTQTYKDLLKDECVSTFLTWK
ncbi:MAG: hypothetical protein PUD72_03030 [Oscillospiraceae bacterium]|nr:hypothetical protein [Oscillospiraceae bacterium]